MGRPPVRVAELAREPRASEPPVSLHRAHATARGLGDLSHRQAAEQAQLHDLRLDLVDRREPVEDFVEGEDVEGGVALASRVTPSRP